MLALEADLVQITDPSNRTHRTIWAKPVVAALVIVRITWKCIGRVHGVLQNPVRMQDCEGTEEQRLAGGLGLPVNLRNVVCTGVISVAVPMQAHHHLLADPGFRLAGSCRCLKKVPSGLNCILWCM